MKERLVKFWTLLRAAVVLLIASPLSAVSKPASQSNASKPGVEGTWEGILGAGAVKLHLILTVTTTAAGSLAGELNSVDQGAKLVIQNAALDGDKFRFEIARIGGLYEAVLSKDGNQLSGTWTQTGVPAQPLVFHRTAAAPAGSQPAMQDKKSAEHTPKPFAPPLDIVIPMPPQAFKAGGHWNLCYELHAVNYGKWDATLTRLQILSDEEKPRMLADYYDSELYLIIGRPGQDTVKKEIIGPGEVAILYFWVTVDRLEDVPAHLCHRIAMRIGDFPEAITLEGVPVAVNKSPIPVIGAPLEGDNWLAGNGPSNTSLHRRALIPINGRADISQRYAIDWVRLNPDGKTYQGDSKDNKNYRAYGAEIHAVADGVVTQIKDGIQQNIPGDTRAVPMTLETIGGNHVIVQIADNVFALYAHMQPGSLRVKVGEHVLRGQLLGLVGNSGNSTEPHLHFHLCTANSELGCEGLPYAFAAFDLQSDGWGWKASDSHSAPTKLEMQIPAENDIVHFTP
jgi:murein DD-endopeptidase